MPTSYIHHVVIVAALAVAVAGCAAAAAPAASYDEVTRRLVQFSSDLDQDGRVDQWTYMDGNRPIRSEADADGDGRIERWEYFDDEGRLRRVGTSTRNDGVEDTWSWAEDAAGERRVDISRRRDRAIDRRESYRGDALVRVEEDGNADGRMDTWQAFDEGRLREVKVDTGGRGRADRRLVYDAEGRYIGLELDPDGDGAFEPASSGPGVPR